MTSDGDFHAGRERLWRRIDPASLCPPSALRTAGIASAGASENFTQAKQFRRCGSTTAGGAGEQFDTEGPVGGVGGGEDDVGVGLHVRSEGGGAPIQPARGEAMSSGYLADCRVQFGGYGHVDDIHIIAEPARPPQCQGGATDDEQLVGDFAGKLFVKLAEQLKQLAAAQHG